MRRTFLIMAAAAGGVLAVIGGSGVFAALSDTARTGTNSATSAALAPSSDVQLATATWDSTDGGYDCGTFQEDYADPIIAVTDVAPGFWGGFGTLCVRNAGSRDVSLSAFAEDLTDIDTACTGDEELTDTASCGGNGPGELAKVLRVGYSVVDCATGNGGGSSPFLNENALSAHPLGTLAPNATTCIGTSIAYMNSPDPVDVQNAQSDAVTWRLRITGQA